MTKAAQCCSLVLDVMADGPGAPPAFAPAAGRSSFVVEGSPRNIQVVSCRTSSSMSRARSSHDSIARLIACWPRLR
jgi:hypothetical protein